MATERWWVRELATAEDPISLEPLRTLRCPPFHCRADLSLAHATPSDWFDGRVLAMYLVSTASFLHPISRRALTRDECVKLDEHVTVHQLCAAHVVRVFDGAQNGDANVPQLRAQADALLHSLFARDAERRGRAYSAESDAAVSAAPDGGLVVIDDDLRPGQSTPGHEAASSNGAVESFPPLPGSDGGASTSVGEGAGSWSSGDASGGAHLVPPPPPARHIETPQEEEERLARQSRARLAREREAWAAGTAVADARAVAQAQAELATAVAAAAAAAAERVAWEAATALSDVHTARETAAAAEAAAESRREAAAAARALHEAAASGDAPSVMTLLESGHDPTVRLPEFGHRAAYEVASNGDVRDAFRCHRRSHPMAWDWAAACVPSALSEAEEAAEAEAARVAARARKRASERERKERRRREMAEAADAQATLAQAMATDEAAAIEAALRAVQLAIGSVQLDDDEEEEEAAAEAARGGCADEDEAGLRQTALGASTADARDALSALMSEATTRLAQLRSPASVARREREAREAAARARLGGHLTAAQQRLLRGEATTDGEPPAGAAPLDLSDEAASSPAAVPSISVQLSYSGASSEASLSLDAPIGDLFESAREAFTLPAHAFALKLILKGKAVASEDCTVGQALGGLTATAKAPKLMVMASALEAVGEVRSAVSDPRVASFAAEHGSRKGGVPTSKGVRQRKMGR